MINTQSNSYTTLAARLEAAVEAGREYLERNPGIYTFCERPLPGLTVQGLYPSVFPAGATHSQYITTIMSRAIGGYGSFDEQAQHYREEIKPEDVAIIQQALGQLFSDIPSAKVANGVLAFTTEAPTQRDKKMGLRVIQGGKTKASLRT